MFYGYYLLVESYYALISWNLINQVKNHWVDKICSFGGLIWYKSGNKGIKFLTLKAKKKFESLCTWNIMIKYNLSR